MSTQPLARSQLLQHVVAIVAFGRNRSLWREAIAASGAKRSLWREWQPWIRFPEVRR